MIRFALKCDHDHCFESWFQSGSAFDKVKSAGMVSCPACGSTDVVKTLMSPQVQTARKATKEGETPQTDASSLPVPSDKSEFFQKPSKELEAKIAALKAHVEATSDYVGKNFAKEARAMHEGDTPERTIYGEANMAEALSLIEDGISVAPLPFIPARKTN
ncbi:DUF1178 family protein [Falsihalocynthiibacter arcticus]|uniref:Uncharacterized protein n=1 Tax=Falsihalocynthiibacter arcticus TaxID=1579316 RepID=A0A126UW13_9RHOB|nr:DUF1178 family protein [Falsihalocynthiibacter arcticus]AML50263.1 hypothetical protein RC74_02365 [Falsihalocynthiibacter arcticus]